MPDWLLHLLFILRLSMKESIYLTLGFHWLPFLIQDWFFLIYISNGPYSGLMLPSQIHLNGDLPKVHNCNWAMDLKTLYINLYHNSNSPKDTFPNQLIYHNTLAQLKLPILSEITFLDDQSISNTKTPTPIKNQVAIFF